MIGRSRGGRLLLNFTIKAGERELDAVLHQPSADSFNTALIICHGFRGSKDGGGRATCLAEMSAGLGLSVLRFDFSPVESLSSQVYELKFVVEYCRKNVAPNIILLGRSMGGSCSLAFAAEDLDIRGLVLWATPFNLLETFRLSLGEAYELLESGESIVVDDAYGKHIIKPEIKDDFRNYDLLSCVQKIKMPILIIHGSNDKVVPLSQAELMWRHANEPKRLVIIDGGDHQLADHSKHTSVTVLSWLKQHFLRTV